MTDRKIDSVRRSGKRAAFFVQTSVFLQGFPICISSMSLDTIFSFSPLPLVDSRTSGIP